MTSAEVQDKLSMGYRIVAESSEDRDAVFDRLDDLGYDTESIRDFWSRNHERRAWFFVGTDSLHRDSKYITTWGGTNDLEISLSDFLGDRPAPLPDAEFKVALDAFLS